MSRPAPAKASSANSGGIRHRWEVLAGGFTVRRSIAKRENRGIALFLANLANDFAFPAMGTVFGHRHALQSSGLVGWYRACLARRFAGARRGHPRSSSLGTERGKSARSGETGPMAFLHRS